jgi:hypothetical protein
VRAGSWIGLLVVVGVVLYASKGIMDRGANPIADGRPWRSDTAPLIDEPGVEQHASSPQLRVVGDLDRPIAVRPGDVVHIEALQLPAGGGAVQLELDLEVASKDAEPRPVRVYFGGRVVRELETGPLDGDLMQARVAIPSALFAESGRYMIEVETTEKATMPIRRYSIELHGR